MRTTGFAPTLKQCEIFLFHSYFPSMTDIDRINSFLQKNLRNENRNEVAAVEAASWLDRAELLKDSRDRPGRELRKLLRENLIHGQEQLTNRRWIIRSIHPDPKTPRSIESASKSDRFKKTDLNADTSAIISSFRNPLTFTNREEAISKNSPIPRSSGLYAWYIRNMPEIVPVDDCAQFEDYYLMYVGISPKKKGRNGNLRERIQTHFGKKTSNDASWSTLRMSLGCLLCEQLDISLQCVKERKHFNDGENVLSEWMAKNAMVTWYDCSCPWDIEKDVIRQLSLPLNLVHNGQHPFYNYLSKLRKTRKSQCN